MSESKRVSAARTAGEDGVADGSLSDVCVVCGAGIGTCVERNMWYVCTDARMNRQESGMTASPNRRVNEGAENACMCQILRRPGIRG